MAYRRPLAAFVFAATIILFTTPVLAQIPRTISFQGVLADGQGNLLPDNSYNLTLSVYDQATGGNPIFAESQRATVSRGVFSVVIGSTNGGLPTSIDFNKQYWLGVAVENGAELQPRTPFTAVPYALNAALAQTAINADTAAHARHASTADQAARAANADTALSMRGGFVASLNGQQGAVQIVGAGATTVTQNGSIVTVRSTDQTGGIQRVENLDGSLLIDPPNGPFVSLSIRAGGVQTFHLSDLSVTTQKLVDGSVVNAKIGPDAITTDKIRTGAVQNSDIQNNAVDVAKLTTGGAAAGSALMSAGVATPVWQNPVAANLPFVASLAQPGVLWSLTNTGAGGAGSFAVSNASSGATALSVTTNGTGWGATIEGTSNGLQVSGGAVGLKILSGRLVGSVTSVAGGTSVGSAGAIGATGIVIDVQDNGVAGTQAYVTLPTSVDNGTVLLVGTRDPDGASIDGFLIGANQFATFARIGDAWKIQL